jgi:hypothetical protein
VTVHGFRSTFRDWAGDFTDYSREICEAVLSRAVLNPIAARLSEIAVAATATTIVFHVHVRKLDLVRRFHIGKRVCPAIAVPPANACTQLSAGGAHIKPSSDENSGSHAGCASLRVHVQVTCPYAVRFHSQTGRLLPGGWWRDVAERGAIIAPAPQHSGRSGRGSSIVAVMAMFS